MGAPAVRLAGWQAILDTPPGVKAEVVAGELVTSPRPTPVHGRVQIALSSFLWGPFDLGGDGSGGWWILPEPDVLLGEHDIVSPDIAGWRRERVPEFPAERPVEQVPDWVCEVLSPGTARHDRTVKADLYLRSGVGHLWLVDGTQRLLEAYEAADRRWLRLGAWGDGDRVAVAPFAEVELDVGTLFPPLPPEPAASGDDDALPGEGADHGSGERAG